MDGEFMCTGCSLTLPASRYYFKSNGRRQGTLCRSCWSSRYYRNRSDEIKTRVADRRREAYQRRPVEASCLQCSVPIVRTVGANGTMPMFCSRQCKDAHRRAQERAVREASKPERRCVWCGADMPRKMRADAMFCSSDCNSAAHRTMRNWRRRSGETGVRPRKNPLPSFIDIAERDRWMCGICGKPVNQKRKYPDPLAGSLDHLLPVSLGGSHDPANLQLAHFRCNWSKRADATNEQLRLIG
jgi:endogenous inhibitor of DNA gyrase (YacG/DUF329 family)